MSWEEAVFFEKGEKTVAGWMGDLETAERVAVLALQTSQARDNLIFQLIFLQLISKRR